MGLIKQTWTLTKKNLRIAFMRQWFTTLVRAFFAPIIFMFLITYTKNFFVPPATYGIGEPHPIRSLENALSASDGGRDTVVFVNNGLLGGDIENVIEILTERVESAGKTARVIEDDIGLLDICQSSLQGVTPCYGAVSFMSSPDEGPDGIWNYTLRADGAFGDSVYVDTDDNEAEIYVLPFHHAIDSAIGQVSGTELPDEVLALLFTSETNDEREEDITEEYMDSLIEIVGVALLIAVIGIVYQLTGHLAQERELGMSQLIDAMTPNAQHWKTQAARLLSFHIAYDLIYLPGWILMGVILWRLAYNDSAGIIPVVFLVLAGFAMASWSIALGSFFRKAQLSGIAVVLLSIVMGIIVQVQRPESTAGIAILALFFPPMTFVLFIIYMAHFQAQSIGANLLEGPPDAGWNVPGLVFWVFFIIQTLMYPIVGALIERWLHGTKSKTRKLHPESEGGTKALVLSNFSKHFVPGAIQKRLPKVFGQIRETVLAVQDLSLEILKGQIVVLLGANGSGKSTTLEAISGLKTATSGTIDIYGDKGFGLCPQKSVLWDDLTVLEHVIIFDRLKTTSKPSNLATLKQLVIDCDLELKMHARSKTLSGGQKRKLQLAMMFTGGSTVCCVDEVSSGLDPLSRRRIWDILLAERGKRTILLTTHFLDEADLLSDHIAILSKGKLVADGSAVQLKHAYGGGYRVYVPVNTPLVPQGEWASIYSLAQYDLRMYQVADSSQAARFVAYLEQNGVHDYQVSGPTIEDVFLKLAEEIYNPTSDSQTDLTSNETGDSSRDGYNEKANNRHAGKGGLHLADSKGTGMLRQAWEMFRKRAIIVRRNFFPYLAALVIPIATAGLATLFVADVQDPTCRPQDLRSDPTLYSFEVPREYSIPVGPLSNFDSEDILLSGETLRSGDALNDTAFEFVESRNEFTNYIEDNYASVVPGGFFVEENETPLFAFVADDRVSNAVLAQNLVNVELLGIPIAASYLSFEDTFPSSSQDSLQLILYFGLAMSAFPALFALYPTAERIRKVRALHYSNGVRTVPLWVAYLLFDVLFVLLISTLAIVIFVAETDIWYKPGYLFLIFFLYGITATLYAYLVSLYTTSQLAAFAIAAGGQCSLFLLYFIAYMVILTYSPATDIDQNLDYAHFTIAAIAPSGNLMRALLLTLNQFNLLCDDNEVTDTPMSLDTYGGPVLYLLIQAFVLFGLLVILDSGWRPSFLVRTNAAYSDAEHAPMEGVDREVFTEADRVANSDDPLRTLHISKAFGHKTVVQDISFGIKRGEIFALLGPNGAGKSTTITLIRGDIMPSGHHGDILVENKSVVKHRASARANLGVCPQFDAIDQMTVSEHLRFYARVRGATNVKHNVEEIIRGVGLDRFRNRMAAKLSGGNKRKLSLGIALIGNPSVILLDEPSSGMDAASKRVMWRTLSSVMAGRSLLLTTHSMEEADALATRAGIMAKNMLALGSIPALRKRHGDTYNVHLVHKDAPATSEADMARIKEWIHTTIPAAVVEERVFHGQVRFSVPSSLYTHETAGYEKQNTASTSSSSSSENNDAITATNTNGGPGVQGQRQGVSTLFTLLESNIHALGLEYYSVSQSTLDQVFLNIIGKHRIEEENNERSKKEEKKMKRKGGVMGLLMRLVGR